VGRAPIRQDESFETGGLLQNIVQNVTVLAGPVAVDLVVRAHYRGNIRILDGDFKRQQIGFPHDPLVRHDDVADIAAGLLIVERIVLHIAQDALCLEAFHRLAIQPAGQNRIFAKYSKLRPLRGSRVMSTPPPRDML